MSAGSNVKESFGGWVTKKAIHCVSCFFVIPGYPIHLYFRKKNLYHGHRHKAFHQLRIFDSLIGKSGVFRGLFCLKPRSVFLLADRSVLPLFLCLSAPPRLLAVNCFILVSVKY
jgi:hypothetical protein